MDIDQYSFCPCGSGKKFKWCCQNIYGDIERAYNQLQEGQIEAALRIMTELAASHPNNPEVFGQQAQIFLAAEKPEEAEKALARAFELNPTYPFGLLLQARLRSDEGEFAGALILARRAAEAYHPEALDYVAQVYALIYQLEMKRNRPLAAQAALRILIHCEPGDQQLRDAYDAAFGSQSALPLCARENYTFLSPSPLVRGERREAWDRVLKQIDSPRLNSLAAAFEQLTVQDPNDAPAWFNLALVQAWLGENRKAIDALDKYIPLEQDDPRAARAGALGQVLTCCAGMESESDYCSHYALYQCRDFEALGKLLQEWQEAGLLLARQSEQEGIISGMILESDRPSIITTATASTTPDRRLAGYLLLGGNNMRLWSPSEEALNRLREQLRTRIGAGVTEGPVSIGPGSFGDVVSEALVFPGGDLTPEAARNQIIASAQKHFEEVWIHRPLRALAGNTPLDAVGSSVLRKKLLGVIQFMQECAAMGILSDYDFGKLRHKLNLTINVAPEIKPEPVLDISAMNAADLAGLDPSNLTDEQLERGFQVAQKLDAGEVSARFVRALVGRNVPAERQPLDRYPLFAFLILRSLTENDLDAALDHINEGERQDCEFNAGRRRNDYELRRAQIHVKRREPDQAYDVFASLIARSPDSLRYRGSAAEGMLTLKQGARALEFAEGGLATARRQQDRDSEEMLMELAAAAKKQM